MSYPVWDWDKITGSGMPSAFETTWVDPILSQDKDFGDDATAPEDVSGYMLFLVSFIRIRPQGFYYVMQFRYTQRNQPFLIRWPWEMAGVPDTSFAAEPGGRSPFHSEIEVLAGCGPTQLVRFTQDKLPFQRLRTPGYWGTTSPIELRWA